MLLRRKLTAHQEIERVTAECEPPAEAIDMELLEHVSPIEGGHN